MANRAPRGRLLTRAQIEEVVRFDMAKRLGGDFDGRRLGSVTGPRAASVMDAWINFHGRAPGPGEMPTRKTLRYNYIVSRRARGGKRPEVDVVHVAVRLNRGYTPIVKTVALVRIDRDEILFRDMGYHQVAGWIVYWDRSDFERKAVRSWMSPMFAGEWESEKYRRGCGLAFPWHETVNPDALNGTRYEWCQWAPDCGGLVDWLKLYRVEPRIELLAKMGLHRLCTPAAAKALHDRKVFDYLRANMDELKRARVPWGAQEFVWAARRGVHVREGVAHFKLVDHMRGRLLIKGLRLDYERLRKALPKWGVDEMVYCQYLDECRRAGLDLRNEGTLYPPTSGGRAAFLARLEGVEQEAARRERAEARRQLREKRRHAAEEAKRAAELLKVRIPEMERFQRSADRVLELSGLGYRLVVAKTQDELLAEGRKMGNCVGCGTYGRGILEGRCLIVMVRDSRGRPFCDMEIVRDGWQVRQCYARHNGAAPEDVQALAKSLAEKFKADEKRRAKRAERRAS